MIPVWLLGKDWTQAGCARWRRGDQRRAISAAQRISFKSSACLTTHG